MPHLIKFFYAFGGISRALSNRNYRVYWSGQAVMVQGFWIYKIVAGWLMWEITNSSAWLGALAAGYMLPVLFIGPFGGTVADRYGYQRMAIIMCCIGILIALLTTILTWFQFITPALLVVLALFQGIVFAFEFPARQSLFPLLVKRQDMAAAVAVNATTFHSSGFTGPLLGGIILTFGDTTTGVSIGFLTNALCMAWMLIALTRISTPQKTTMKPVIKNSNGLVDDLIDGIKYAWNYRDLRLLLFLSFIASLLIRNYLDFLPGFSDEIFNKGKEGLATLTAVSGVGSMVFATFFAIRGRAKGLVSVLCICQIGATIALIWFSLLNEFIIALLALSLVGGLLVSSSIAAQSLIQHNVVDEYRARIISIHISISVGAPALSALTIGWMAEYLGLQISITGSAILGLLTTIPLCIMLIKRKKEIEAERI
jgi:MFS family permease